MVSFGEEMRFFTLSRLALVVPTLFTRPGASRWVSWFRVFAVLELTPFGHCCFLQQGRPFFINPVLLI